MKIVLVITLALIALIPMGLSQVTDPISTVPPWAQKLEALGEGIPKDGDNWVLEVWHPTMGDLQFFFEARPQALPNGTIRLCPYTGAPKNEKWWVSWPDEGTFVIRRTNSVDFQ